jgi:hypothetical protein
MILMVCFFHFFQMLFQIEKKKIYIYCYRKDIEFNYRFSANIESNLIKFNSLVFFSILFFFCYVCPIGCLNRKWGSIYCWCCLPCLQCTTSKLYNNSNMHEDNKQWIFIFRNNKRNRNNHWKFLLPAGISDNIFLFCVAI